MALDARGGNPRNPLADGSLTFRTAQQVSAVFLVPSIICMVLLPAYLRPIALAVLFVFVTYSFFVKAKNIAGLDLVYHALFPALYGVLGYVLYHPLDMTGLVFLSCSEYSGQSVRFATRSSIWKKTGPRQKILSWSWGNAGDFTC
jgi:4-hydroxybenzoate polyprenyltransferase